MVCVNRKNTVREETAAFVRLCDREFSRRMNRQVHSIVSDDSVRCITLSGPTCSGKTTIAKTLTAEIAAAGKNAVIVSVDDFFHPRSVLQASAHEDDYDSVAAIDLELLADRLHRMLSAQPADLPEFDFVSGERVWKRKYSPAPHDVLIVEGIQAVYPEVVALFDGYPVQRIFVGVNDSIMVNGICFSAIEIRLARRIVRDYHFRAASPVFTWNIWKSVRANEDANIFPNAGICQYQLNSLQPYEPFMIGQYVIPLLKDILDHDRSAVEAEQLYQKFLAIAGHEIPAEYLSPDSLYHEFLG